MKVTLVKLTPSIPQYEDYFRQLSDRLATNDEEATIEDIGSWINSHAAIYLAVKDTVIGYCVIVDDDRWENDCPALLDVIYLDEKFRGKGYGKKLITFAITDYYRNNHKNLVLFVENSNEIAYNLYKSVGFTKLGSFYHIMGYGDKIHQLILNSK